MKSVTSLRTALLNQRAFTLIEILIAVAITAIIAAIALPAYSKFIFQSDVRAVQADLLSLSLKMESQYQRTLEYPVLADDKKNTTAGIMDTLAIKGRSPNSNPRDFNFKFETTTKTAYKITAEGKNDSRQKDCKISLTQDNVRTTSNCKYLTDGKWL